MGSFQFDTRDTKPSLKPLVIWTLIAAALAAGLFYTLRDNRGIVLCMLSAVYAAGTIAVLLWAFREQIRYNPYSYNTIFYFGFALFAVFVLITLLVLAVRMVTEPVYSDEMYIVHTIYGSNQNYMIITFPVLFIFCIALCISNIALIIREGRRLVNVLGIILSVLVIGVSVFLFIFNFSFSGSEREAMIYDLIVNIIASVYLYAECMLLGTMVADAIAAKYEPEKNKDYLIILGCGLRDDGTPTPLLRGRIDRALEFCERQKKETGKDLTFITSGGQGPNEPVSESAAMKRYLMEKGIPEDRIIEEDRSTDTAENMEFSKAIIWERDPGAKVAFSTTNYHVFRSGLFARRVKMRAVGMGAKTKWYFWPNAAVREFVGLLTKHILKQLLILGGIVLFYVALTFIEYTP